MKPLAPLLLGAMFLAGCSRGDDAAPAAPPRLTEKFASSHFLQYLNRQPSLAAGSYELRVSTAASTVNFTVHAAFSDGGATMQSGSIGAGGVGAIDLGTLSRAGGADITVSSSGPMCVALDFRNQGLDHVVARDGDSDPSDPDCDTGLTNPSLHLPSSKTDDVAYAHAYYATIDPNGDRDTLEKWKTAAGFLPPGAQPVAPVAEYHVIFRDTKDLGYGRDMYFHDNGNGTYAAYVANFALNDLPGQTYGSLSLDAAIAQVAKYHLVTYAIEYGPIDADGVGGFDDINGDGVVDAADYFPRFYNFSPTPPYARRETVDLDGKGAKAMPTPCTVCHAGRVDALLPAPVNANSAGRFPRSGDTYAHLQPLDVGTFEFSAKAPWRRADLEPALKAINRAVHDSYAALATPHPGQWNSSMAIELLEGWYGGPGLPGAFDDQYLPAGWEPDPNAGAPPAGADALYHEVLADNCRSCHLLRGQAEQSDTDLTSWAKFIGYADLTEPMVFDDGLMPLAAVTYDNFQEAPAKVEMLASFLPNFSHAAADGSLLLPGRPVARAGPDRRSPAPVAVSGTASRFATTWAWSVVSQPVGANPTLLGADTVRATLDSAIDGAYVLRLVVGDGARSSAPDTVTVTVDSTMNPAPSALTFAANIRPVLTSAGCTSCHTEGGNPRPPVFFSDPGAGNRDVYATVRSLVNFDDPEHSSLLLKASGRHHAGGVAPGFDPAGNHAGYDMFLNWILEGAVEN